VTIIVIGSDDKISGTAVVTPPPAEVDDAETDDIEDEEN